MVKGPTPDYVHTEISARRLQAGKAGGVPYFFDAVIPLDLNPGTVVHEVTARLRRGVTVTGQVLAQDGRPVASGLLLSPTYIPVGYELQGHTFPVRDGRFTLPGCDPEKSVPVLFFDPKGSEGAVMEMPPNRSSGEPLVRLAPCGTAAFRCLDAGGKAMRNPPMRLYALLRPGAPVQESIDRGVVPALVVQWTQVGGVSCASLDTQDGTMTFSNLIPGATYLVQVDDTFGFTPRASVTVQPGQHLPLQNVTLKRPKK